MSPSPLAGVTVTALPSDVAARLPHPKRCLELGFPQAAIEADGQLLIGTLNLRTSPVEAAVLALSIQAAIGDAVMEEARRWAQHGPAGDDTGVLYRLRDRLHEI